MEPRRCLRCLGHPVLFAATGEPVKFRTRKHLALLVYIAVEARPHRRDRLAELLWPKVSGAEARHSLATALFTLRPVLGTDGLETSRDQVRLVPGRVSLDLDRLEAGDVLGSDMSGPLEVAGFLEGFDICDAAEFTQWKDRQQARLLPIIKDALLKLIDRCRRTGDSRQIEQLADRMLGIDELSEEAIRAKMEARAFAGDRLTALEIFEAWKTKLAEELQAAPSDLVEGIAVRLRRRAWERTTLTNIPNVPTDQWRGRPFIGRTVEYRMLYEAWESVKKGVPSHALILGDSGVGKTTLVQRLTTAAGLEGAAITRVQCYDVEREIPYSTLSSLVLGLLDRPGVSATAPEDLAELSRTVPEVRHRFPNIPAPSDSQGEAARIRTTEAFHQMLTAIAEEHPVILVIDDLHLADDVSVSVLHLMMRRASKQPVMVVLIARPGEFPQLSQASRLRESGRALGIRQIELAPLTETESREMLQSLLRPDEHQPGISEQRALLQASAGYPMVLELLVQDWRTSGSQSLALAVDAMTAEMAPGGPADGGYHQILDRIIRTLDGTTYSVLKLASVLGHRLNELGMYAIVDLSTAQTMTSMAELVSRRVLRDGPRGLEFVNELVRAAAYVGVPVTLRRVLHGNIADRFIQRHRRGEDLGLEIAWHCIRAGREKEATPHLLRGARQAVLGGALHAAERALSSALSHLAGTERVDALILLAEVLQEQGRWLESLAVLDDQAIRENTSSSGWVVVLTLTAKFHLYRCTPEEIRERVSALIEVIKESASTSLQIAAAGAAATLVGDIRDHSLAQVVLDSLSLVPMNNLNQDDLSKLSLGKARLLFHIHDRVSSLQEIEAATSRLDADGAITTTAAQFQAGLGVLSCMDGHYEKSLTYLRSAYNIAVRLGNDTLRSALAANLALVHGRIGRYEDQLSWAEEALALGKGDSAHYHDVLAAYCGAFGSIFSNQVSRAKEFISTAESRISGGLPDWALQAWRLYSADLYLLLGDEIKSHESGLLATTGANATLHSRAFAGIFSRWTAALAGSSQGVEKAFALIRGFAMHLALYDALDRSEILASLLFLQRKNGQAFDESEALLGDQLKRLPPAVSLQMKRLGMLL
jgi:DNA-binding SARP family transcriptional activator/tetratricopeptide (TPR) repeat protein